MLVLIKLMHLFWPVVLELISFWCFASLVYLTALTHCIFIVVARELTQLYGSYPRCFFMSSFNLLAHPGSDQWNLN